MSLAEGVRVKTRDGKEGVLVGSDDDRIWCDVRIGKGKAEKVEHFHRDELTIIDANPAPARDESIIPTGDIRHKDLVQVPDGRVGFAIALQDRIRWTVAFPDGSTQIFGEAGLRKMIAIETPKRDDVAIFSNQLVRLSDGRTGFTQKLARGGQWKVYISTTHKSELVPEDQLIPVEIGEPVAPKVEKCTAIVPVSAVKTQAESTFKRCEPLMRPALYVPSELSLFMLYLGAVKEIKRLRTHKVTAIEPTTKPDIIVSKPIKQSDDLFTKAVQSGKFSPKELSRIGDAQAFLNSMKLKMETTS